MDRSKRPRDPQRDPPLRYGTGYSLPLRGLPIHASVCSAGAALCGCCSCTNETLQPGVLAGDGEDGVIVVYKDADTVPSIKYMQMHGVRMPSIVCWILPGGLFGGYVLV